MTRAAPRHKITQPGSRAGARCGRERPTIPTLASNQSDQARAAEIHRRLLAGDPVASSLAFEAYYPRLVARLRRAFATHADLAEDAASRALCDYLMRPGQYDPSRRGLAGYLFMAARRDMQNLVSRERRHANAVSIENVENDPLLRNDPVEEHMTRLMRDEDLAPARQRVASIELPAAEQRVLDLMLAGVRAHEHFAVALGLTGRPLDEQRRQVKRAKDRLKKRLARQPDRASSDG